MEILSPAGSFQSLEGAVANGADAVYVGGNRFSARKHAQNFTDEELKQAVDFCHVRGVKLYVCCNTLLKESELKEAMEFVSFLYTVGVDAVIVQDLGLFSLIRSTFPDMPIHCSTQMTICNVDGVNLLAERGAKRVVLAREVTKDELSQIAKNSRAELEYFVHGALCISYSGQCLMSSILGGRSGNRGSCAQPCRLSYTLQKNGVTISDKETLLCPKDLCLADRVKEIADLNVTSLKIEGRMKSPEYVSAVTKVYKQAVSGGVTEEEIREMLKFFSRGGSCYGYFDGPLYKKMIDTGENSKISSALPSVNTKVKLTAVSLLFTARENQAITLTMTHETGLSVEKQGAICQHARTRPTEKERVIEQLAKLGDTPFYASKTQVDIAGNVMIPIKEINAIRREAARELEEKIASSFRRSLPHIVVDEQVVKPYSGELSLSVEVTTKEQLQSAMDMGISRIYMPENLLDETGGKGILQLPPTTKEGRPLTETEGEVCVQNLGQLSFYQGKTITAGHRLNITNSESLRFLASCGVSRAVLSPELNVKAIKTITEETDMPLEVIGYGRLPLMLLEHCIIKSKCGCRCDEGQYSLLDRKGEVFPVVPRHCGNVIYNSKPVYMADRIEDLKSLHLAGIRLQFTLENYDTCCIIIREYQNALQGKPIKAKEGNFTRGHFYRGMQ